MYNAKVTWHNVRQCNVQSCHVRTMSCHVMLCHVMDVWTTGKSNQCLPFIDVLFLNLPVTAPPDIKKHGVFQRLRSLRNLPTFVAYAFFTGCTWFVIAWSQDCSWWWYMRNLTCQESFQDFRKAECIILGCTCWDIRGRQRRRANEDEQQVEKMSY